MSTAVEVCENLLVSTSSSEALQESPVCSYNEWDPLEEVIVGVVDGACFPPRHIAIEAALGKVQSENLCKQAGKSFPLERIKAAGKELEEFVQILEGEGVTVQRPLPMEPGQSFAAPGWTSTGLYHAMPRDALLVIGTEIIECPLAWRSRYCETFGYRPLLKKYFHAGAKWCSAPKPELKDSQFDTAWTESQHGEPMRYVISEFEPTFDAADFTRCGRDIIAQKSHVTNAFGIDWLRRHIGDQYTIHVLEFNDSHPMHIDATLVPMAEGKLLINPERVLKVPQLFKSWDIIQAPQPIIPDSHPLYMTSKWINMNILMLDQQRVIVEYQDEPMIKVLKRSGFKPIPCHFRNFNSFGGSFHCATLDVRRRGALQSYF